MSGSSYWPMSAVYVHGTAPLSRIHATATEVSSPPEKAMPTRSPTGREVRTLDTDQVCIAMHDHAKVGGRSAEGDGAEQGRGPVRVAVHGHRLQRDPPPGGQEQLPGRAGEGGHR